MRILLILYFFIAGFSLAAKEKNPVLEELDRVLLKKEVYLKKKYHKIAAIKKDVSKFSSGLRVFCSVFF